jgi:MFS family permease
MNTAKLVGFIVGGVISVFLVLIILKFINKDSSLRAKYDERQHIVRGRAYRIAFWTAVILLALYSFIDAYKIDIPIKRHVIPFIIIMISVLVHTSYAILNDGYFGMNESRKRAMVMFVLIGLLNFGISILEMNRGQMIEDGKLSSPFMNLICGISFVIIGIVLFIKSRISKDDYAEEEE